MDATYYQRALKSKLLVLAGAAAIALGLCLAPRPALASELIDGSVEPIMSYSRQADAGMPSPFLGTANGLSVLLQLLQWLRDFDGASGWLGPKLLRPRLWVCELQLTTCF